MRKLKATKKHAGGRPRTRPYIRLRSLLKSDAKRVKPIKLKPTSKIAQLLREIVSRAIKHALVDHYKATGLIWQGENGCLRQLSQLLRCPEHGEFHDAVSAKCTVDVKHPRVRIPLPCGYRLDLKMWCPFCGWQIKPSKNFFRCSNPRGPNYPERCFCFPVDKAEEVVKREFGE